MYCWVFLVWCWMCVLVSCRVGICWLFLVVWLIVWSVVLIVCVWLVRVILGLVGVVMG